MFIRLSALLPVAALAAAVAAAPSALEARQSQCNTGALQCCNATYQMNDPTITQLTGLLGIAIPNIAGLVGLTCNPITAIGTGSGASCTQQPVCCTNNQFNGVINFGCSPVNIGL